MSFFGPYLHALAVILSLMTVLWIVSIFLKNVSIVDIFWGFGFAAAATVYYFSSRGEDSSRLLVLTLCLAWGLRLTVYLAIRNSGKGEDFRYRQFRKNYGENRYWWISYFQTFLLQGILMWLISAPLLGAMLRPVSGSLNYIDYIALAVWIIGFTFEAGGDYQLARFRSDPSNKGKVLDRGFWKYTRHPNYFGDAAVWWSFGLFSVASGYYLPVLGSILMTALIIKVSGVALLEKSLRSQKPEYAEYERKTSSFLPWFPRK